MKKRQRVWLLAVLLFSLVMTSVRPLPAQAADQGSKTVTVHKLLTSSGDFDTFPTVEEYDGSQDSEQFKALLKKYELDQEDALMGYTGFRGSVREIGDVYFALQNGEGQWIDKTGQVVASADEAYGMLTTPTGGVFDTSHLPAGKYKLVEIYEKSTFKDDSSLLTHGKAVPVEIVLPLLKADGTTIENAHVYPKNITYSPSLLKKQKLPGTFKIVYTPSGDEDGYNRTEYATLGTVVEYSIDVTIPDKAKYKHLSFVDTMTEGLTLQSNPFGQRVYIATELRAGVPQYEQGADKDYTVEYASNQSFTLTFTPKGLEKLLDAVEKGYRTFTIRYSAYVNANAYTKDRQENTVTMHYGNNPSVLLQKTSKTDLPITSTKIVKMDGRTGERLPLAQFTAKTRAKDPTDGLEKDFYLAWKPVTGYGVRAEEEAKIATLTEKQTLFHAALDAYNALSKTQKEDPVEQKKVLDAKKAFDDAFAAAHVTYVWDTEKTNPNVLRLTSNEKGQFYLLGYYDNSSTPRLRSAVDHIKVEKFVLEEVVPPVGYSSLVDPIAMTREYSSTRETYIFETNLPETLYDEDKVDLGNAYRINNVKISIPQTGGIGSLIFVGLGAVFAGIAIYYLRDRKDKEEIESKNH